MAGLDIGLHVAQVRGQCGQAVHVQRGRRSVRDGRAVGPEHGGEIGAGREQPGPQVRIDGVLRLQALQLACKQGVGGAFLRRQAGRVNGLKFGQHRARAALAPRVVLCRLAEQHAVGHGLAGQCS